VWRKLALIFVFLLLLRFFPTESVSTPNALKAHLLPTKRVQQTMQPTDGGSIFKSFECNPSFQHSRQLLRDTSDVWRCVREREMGLERGSYLLVWESFYLPHRFIFLGKIRVTCISMDVQYCNYLTPVSFINIKVCQRTKEYYNFLRNCSCCTQLATHWQFFNGKYITLTNFCYCLQIFAFTLLTLYNYKYSTLK